MGKAGWTTRVLRGGAVVVAAVLAAVVVPVVMPVTAAATPEANGCFVQRSYRVFLDRDGTASEIWTDADRLAGGWPRSRVPTSLASSDEWLTVEVTALYEQALDRGPDPTGRAYWVGRLRQGALVNAIASQIYGSPEFYARAGGTDDAFVTDLYRRILGRSPDAAGLAFWRSELDRRGRARVAAEFFASVESRRDRVTRLYHEVLGRGPDGAGLSYWIGQLRTSNDVWLAASLASSDEFFARAQVGCTLPPRPPSGQVAITGRGWGHGRGMGQYGALGYAVDHGWSGTQILDHYYGGTTTVTRGDDPTQRVYLTGSDGMDLTVTQASGNLRVPGHGGDVAAVSIRRLSATHFRVYRSASASCSGPWTLVGDTAATDVAVTSSASQGDVADRMLRDCRSGRTYRGSLHAVRASRPGGKDFVTVNRVATEAMLRAIVPAEVPASWANAGGGKGAAAVRAQAVAARSYALAGDTRWGSWATTCDSAQCQVYGGFGAEHPLTTEAVGATARQVRQHGNGAVARTEFSSSTGGWTAGGTFPAVVDLGDAVASNPNHLWTGTKTVAQVEAAMGCGCGAFVRFDQWSRNGLGDMGGRVSQVRVVFTGGSVTRTGDQVRVALGLKSNWFTA